MHRKKFQGRILEKLWPLEGGTGEFRGSRGEFNFSLYILQYCVNIFYHKSVLFCDQFKSKYIRKKSREIKTISLRINYYWYLYNYFNNYSNMMLDFPGGSVVKNLLSMQETKEMQVRSLGHDNPLEESMATHSSILAWEIPWTEEPGGLESMRSQRVGHDWSVWICTHSHDAFIF